MLDLSAAMLANLPAIGTLQASTPVCGDVEQMPLPSHSVDMVFCNAVLEWCELEASPGRVPEGAKA